MTSYIIPAIFITVLCLGAIKRKNAYRSFTRGAGQALELIKSVFPYLCAVMLAVEAFRASGVSGAVCKFISPITSLVGIPEQLCELILIRPLSGAGALAVLESVFSSYGVDTFVGNCASVIYGSSETVFYLATIYFSKCEVKRLSYALPVALFCTFLGYVVGCAVMRFI